MATDTAPDLLSAGPLREIRLDLTTRCNLRCVYCALSQRSWQGADMPLALAERAVALIGQITGDAVLPAVHVNGHGETTFLAGWVDICQSLLDQNMPLIMTTNLAKEFTAKEFDVLARMDTIMVSIDTADPELLRRMRRKVSLATIVRNMEEIRTTAHRFKSPAPSFRISCGLYDRNTLDIEGLARFAVAYEFRGVGFWNLSSWTFDKFPYEGTDVAVEDRAYPLDDLSNDDLRPRLEAIKSAMSILRNAGLDVHVNGDFLEILAGRLDPESRPVQTARSHDLPEGMTRDCLDPWGYLELNTNGDVQPCCAHTKVGNLNNEDLPEILNGSAIRQLRQALLEGTLDAECANCRLRPPIRPDGLQRRVSAMLGNAETNYAFRAARVHDLFKSAHDNLKGGRHDDVWPNVRKALAIDPGIQGIPVDDAVTARACVPHVLDAARFPLTLTWLAGIFRHLNDNETAIQLLKRYLDLVPDAPDRENVLQGIRDAEWTIESAMAAPGSSGGFLLKQFTWIRARIRFRTRLRHIWRQR